ncbi:MAG: glycosyltransferase family 4 protein [bacterium]
MRILTIDKFYFIKGGAERYYFELKRILEEHGHTVIPFSMVHPDNYDTPYSDYFVDHIEFNGLSTLRSIVESPKIIGRILYSKQAKQGIKRLIDDTNPDIAHLHMIDHQLSPSILDVLRDANIPVIQTLHQYKHVCPSYRLFNTRTAQICEKCLDGHLWHPMVEKCHKDSIISSALLVVEAYFHRWLRIYENIDLFHAPSEFMRQKMISGGFSKEKIVKQYYTIRLSDYPFYQDFKDYLIYFGRLSEEKGLLNLLTAMKKVKRLKLLIVGDGPQCVELEKLALKLGLNNVTFVGLKFGAELKQLVSQSRFVVVPSLWYDNSPLVIYEAFAMGKPVIGSNIGGISELIDPGENGYLFSPNDIESLLSYINELGRDNKKVRRFGQNARMKAEKEFNPTLHYQWIMNIYNELLDEKR